MFSSYTLTSLTALSISKSLLENDSEFRYIEILYSFEIYRYNIILFYIEINKKDINSLWKPLVA